jgi:hypothetical protein
MGGGALAVLLLVGIAYWVWSPPSTPKTKEERPPTVKLAVSGKPILDAGSAGSSGPVLDGALGGSGGPVLDAGLADSVSPFLDGGLAAIINPTTEGDRAGSETSMVDAGHADVVIPTLDGGVVPPKPRRRSFQASNIPIEWAPNAVDAERQRKLIEDAQKARKSGNHTVALNLAGEAARIWLTPSLRLFIAEEQSASYQLATALVNAEACLADAGKDGTLQNREKLLQACNSLIAALKKSAAQVIVEMPNPLPAGARVIVGGHQVPHTLFGKPYLLPPRNVVIQATAPGRVPFEQQLTLKAGQEVRVPVVLPNL